jgi:hypothetical protein
MVILGVLPERLAFLFIFVCVFGVGVCVVCVLCVCCVCCVCERERKRERAACVCYAGVVVPCAKGGPAMSFC